MTSRTKFSFLAFAALGFCTLPLAAQSTGGHVAGAAPIHVAGGTPIHAAGVPQMANHGGTFGPTGGHGIGQGWNHHGNANRRPPNGYGYRGGYYYGYVPYYLPYDSSYDQPEDGGDQGPQQAQDNSQPGPTVFEHNGRPSRMAENEMPPQESRGEQSEEEWPTTVLVFRDGHQEEVANYAIAGNKLIVVFGERTQKIQIGDLDVSATEKANDDRGVDFKLPSQS